MPTLKREIFLRPNRMTHRFGEAIGRGDPLGAESFELNAPKGLRSTNSGHIGRTGIKQNGINRYSESLSAIEKPRGGAASLNGPAPDYAGMVVERPPVSTARRKVTAGAK